MSSPLDDAVACIQHHINCLSDNARFTRKKGLTNIIRQCDEWVDDAKKKPENLALLQQLFEQHLSPALLKMVCDPQENNRTRALGCFTELAGVCDTVPVFQACVSVLRERIAPPKQRELEAEPAEEVRLELVKLLRFLLSREESSFVHVVVMLVEILAKSLMDPFPELKREAGEATCTLARYLAATGEVPKENKNKHYETLTKALAGNLGHQHGKVRISAITALGAVVKARGGDLSPSVVELIPVLSKLTQDRSASVRMVLPHAMYEWLTTLKPSKQNRGRMMMLLLAGVADDNPDVHAAALSALDKVGEALDIANDDATDGDFVLVEGGGDGDGDGDDGDGGDTTSAQSSKADEEKDTKPEVTFDDSSPPTWQPDIAKPLIARASVGARRAIVLTLNEIIPFSVKDLTDWTAGARVRGAGVLHTVLLYSEHYASPYIKEVLPALYRTARDTDNDLNAIVVRVCQAIGWLCDPDVYLPTITSTVLGNADANYRCSILTVLNNLIRGTPPGACAPYMEELVDMVGNEDICTSDAQNVRFYALKLMETMMEKEPALCAEQNVRLKIFLILLKLDAVAQSKEEQQTAVMAMMSLATCQLQNKEMREIYGVHFDDALTRMTKEKDWHKDLSNRAAVFTILKRGAAVIAEHMDMVLPLLCKCAEREQDPRLRVEVMSLLHYLLFSNFDTSFLEEEETMVLITGIIIPQLVWHSGSVAAAIRLQATLCLQGLFRRQLISSKMLMEIDGSLSPVLKGNIDDDDPDIRMAICRCYGHYFELRASPLEHIPLTDLHRDLVKRMDDSNDAIRIEVARIFTLMFKTCFPPFKNYDYSDQHFKYIVKSFLIHLDDSNPEVQQACFAFLKNVCTYNLDTFRGQVEAVRGRHSDPTYLERLIEHANSLLDQPE